MDESDLDLVDKGLLSGAKRLSLHKTANKHFMKFLQLIHSNFKTLEDIPEENFTEDLLGRFSDYLTKNVSSITKYNTHDNYLSAIYVQLCEKYPQKKTLNADYYKKLRANLFEEFKTKESETGTPISKHASTLAEAVNELSVCLNRVEEHLVYLTSCRVAQEKFNNAVIVALQQNNEVMESMHQHIKQVSTSSTVDNRKRNHSTMQGEDQRLIDACASPEANGDQESSQPTRRKTIRELTGSTLQSLFYSWFKDDQVTNLNTEDKQEKCVKKKISKMVIYLKHFLPATSTILQARPNANNANAYQTWLLDLNTASFTAQEGIMKFIVESYRQLQPDKLISKLVISKGAIWAAEKLLDKIPVGMFPRCQVHDGITQSSPDIYNSNDISVFRSP